jgi:hypothetical protein
MTNFYGLVFIIHARFLGAVSQLFMQGDLLWPGILLMLVALVM